MYIESGIVIGSGIDILPFIKIESEISFKKVGLPVPSIKGHSDKFVLTCIAGKKTGVLNGRVHLYEGYSPQEVCRGINFLRSKGARKVVITNAAGIINRRFIPGSLMIIKDQINLTGQSLIKRKKDKVFVDCSRIYDTKKINIFKKICKKFNVKLYTGVLAGVCGPQYETPAEVEMLRRIGADAVCMSTVLEAIQAVALGMSVLGISVLTNIAGSQSMQSHEDIIKVSRRLSEVIFKIIEEFFSDNSNPGGSDNNSASIQSFC